jgi:DNA-binding MarR family transcriptional regulator
MASPPMPDEELLARWQLIVQGVAQTQHRISEQIDEAGIPAQWFAALHLLLHAADRRLPMSRLARDLTMTSGGFTKLADRMAREGLIDRRGSSDDRRVVYATLTEQGVALAQRLTGEFVTALREHVTGVVTDAGLVAMSEAARLLGDAHAGAGRETPDGPDGSDGTDGADGTDSADDEDAVADAGRAVGGRDPALPDRRGRGRSTS